MLYLEIHMFKINFNQRKHELRIDGRLNENDHAPKLCEFLPELFLE